MPRAVFMIPPEGREVERDRRSDSQVRLFMAKHIRGLALFGGGASIGHRVPVNTVMPSSSHTSYMAAPD